MRHTPDAERLDDESPEADQQWFARARPAREILPELFGVDACIAMLRKPGLSADPSAESERISVALDADVVASFRSTGQGWQERLNSVLREWLKDHSPAAKS